MVLEHGDRILHTPRALLGHISLGPGGGGARAHVRPGGLAGLVLWVGELVGTPSVESSSGFLGFGFRGFSLRWHPL